MRHRKRLRHAALVGSLAVGTVISLAGSGVSVGSVTVAKPGLHGFAARQHALHRYLVTHASTSTPTVNRTPDDNDLADQLAQYDFQRTAPAAAIPGAALATAENQASQLPQTAGNWQEFTNQPYQAQPSNYTDPFWGNQGAGFSIVGGRTTALATAPNGAWFAGTADGGVWRSFDHGQHWTPLFDSMP